MTEELIIKQIGLCDQCFANPATVLTIYRHVGFARNFNQTKLLCQKCAVLWRATTKFPTLHDWSNITVDC